MSVYNKKTLINNRYQMLATSSIYTYEDENLISYADFLKKFGRYVTKDGYVDSNKSVHRAQMKQKQQQEQKFQLPLTSVVDGERKRSRSEEGIATTKNVRINLTSVDMANIESERQKNHERHLRSIEDQMIKSKQDERALKRSEGDVKRDQRQIRQSIREFDTVISKKRLEADKNLSKNLEEKKILEIENAHKKENKTKERTEKNRDTQVQNKDKGRKTLLVCNDLSRQYKLKMDQLDIKQSELTNIQSEFESKIRRKEEEETRLKKELAEIALALNMEVVKARNDLYDFRKIIEANRGTQIKQDLASDFELEENKSKTNQYIKNYDMTRRRLSLENEQEKSMWSLRQREANRRIVDARNNLEDIYQRQRQLNETARIAEQEKRANEIERKIEDITNRRLTQQAKLLSERLLKSEETETMLKGKANHRLTELKIRDHEDHLKHFQKLVQKDEEVEQDFYKTVKEAEFAKRKKDMELKKLQEQLTDLKKKNAIQIKEMIARAFAQEQEYEQKILKQKASLEKFIADREETYTKLMSHREKAKEDKYLLETHEKEHVRLVRLLDKNKHVESNQSL